jgi:hypothetical protein
MMCNAAFTVKYPSYKTKTCSKDCKNKLASQITKTHFQDEENREALIKKMKEIAKDPEYRRKFEEGMKGRNFKKEAHPSWGMKRSSESCKRISDGIMRNKEKENVEQMVSKVVKNYSDHKDTMFIFDKKEKMSSKHMRRVVELYKLKQSRGGKCIDCGETNLCLLEFDHQEDKSNVIMNMPIDEMKIEADKCVMRCTLCHAAKSHAEDYNNTRVITQVSENPVNVFNRSLRAIRREYVASIKAGVGKCQKCERECNGDPHLFDFDHVSQEGKVKGIAWYVSHGSSTELINAEIQKCVLLCRNCHALRTRLQMGWYFCDMTDVAKYMLQQAK